MYINIPGHLLRGNILGHLSDQWTQNELHQCDVSQTNIFVVTVYRDNEGFRSAKGERAVTLSVSSTSQVPCATSNSPGSKSSGSSHIRVSHLLRSLSVLSLLAHSSVPLLQRLTLFSPSPDCLSFPQLPFGRLTDYLARYRDLWFVFLPSVEMNKWIH